MLLPPGSIPNVPTPPGSIPNVSPPPAPILNQKPADPPVTRSIGPLPLGNAAPAGNPAVAPATQAAVIPPGLGAISASARFGKDRPAITSGLHWRVYSDKPDDTGVFRMIKEDRGAAPSFTLPQGSYIVHVAFGLANAVKRVQVRTETVREVFEIPAGGVRFEGRVSDARIPGGQITFDVYKGGQLEPGDRRPIASEVATGDLVLLPEGNYHVVSNYGDGNAMIRSDFRIQAAKLTDTQINHRAAIITLKLVGDQRRRSARQHRVVGAHAGRRRDQGIDRRVPDRGAGRGRLRRHRAQRGQGVQPPVQGRARLRPRDRTFGALE